MQKFLYKVVVIPGNLTSALYAALLVYAVQLEVWLAALVEQYLGVQIDFTGAVAIWASLLALVVMAGLKKLLEWVVPEKWHEVVNSFLVWLASLFAARALFGIL
jgi:hypothetical protein